MEKSFETFETHINVQHNKAFDLGLLVCSLEGFKVLYLKCIFVLNGLGLFGFCFPYPHIARFYYFVTKLVFMSYKFTFNIFGSTTFEKDNFTNGWNRQFVFYFFKPFTLRLWGYFINRYIDKIKI